jgi:hypothetical protein
MSSHVWKRLTAPSRLPRSKGRHNEPRPLVVIGQYLRGNIFRAIRKGGVLRQPKTIIEDIGVRKGENDILRWDARVGSGSHNDWRFVHR